MTMMTMMTTMMMTTTMVSKSRLQVGTHEVGMTLPHWATIIPISFFLIEIIITS